MTGFEHIPSFLTDEEQFELTAELRKAVRMAPFFTARMRSGQPYSMLVSNTGDAGFTGCDGEGRYSPRHPESGKPWPSIPEIALEIARKAAGDGYSPNNGQISFFQRASDCEGIYRDTEDVSLSSPLVMLSLGDSALFRLGGKNRADPISHHLMRSGDIVVLRGDVRMFWYGTGGIHPQSSRLPLFKNGGRLCLSLRNAQNKSRKARLSNIHDSIPKRPILDRSHFLSGAPRS